VKSFTTTLALVAAISFGVPASSHAQSYTIGTAAGGAPCCALGDGGQATQAYLSNPMAVAADNTGHFYIVASGIRAVAPGGIISSISLPAGTLQDGLYETVQAIAADTSGNLYVGGSLGTLAVLSATGKITKPIKVAAAIRGLAVDSVGDIFVSNSQTGVTKVTAGGAAATVYPNDFAGKLAKGLAVDTAGNLYVADSALSQIIKVDTSGKSTVAAGVGGGGSYSGDGGPATKAGLKGPSGVAVDSNGNIFISDSGNNRVRKVDATGTISTIAGSGAAAVSGDGGPATNAGLDNPAGIGLGIAGAIYVTEPTHNVVRTLTPVPAAGAPSIKAGGIVPIYSSATTIQPGSWISIFGSNLATGTATWNGDFPTTLGGTQVTIDGKAAYLWYLNPGQINLQAPDDSATGTVEVVVNTASGSAASTVTLGQFGPSFSLLDGKHVTGIILRADGSGAYGGGAYDIIGPTGTSLGFGTVAARPGDFIELFGVGFGPTSPAVPAGQTYSGAAATTSPVTLLVNNVSVTPTFAGLSGAGLDQINFAVPTGLGTGDVPLLATMGGVLTQAGVVISLQ